MTPRFQRFALCLLVLTTASTSVFAGEQKKLKSTSVIIRRLDDAQFKAKIELLLLPPGKITLKRPNAPDQEHVIKPVWMAKYEVRWDDYLVFWQALDLTQNERIHQYNERIKTRTVPPFEPPAGGTTPNGKPWSSPDEGNYPANCIHFQAAQRYCVWLSKYTGKKFRLPTEPEWEYACRAGGPPVKLDPKALDDVAWFKNNSDGQPHAVGEKKPNPWGFYDMLGNVGEYVVRDPRDDKGLLAGGSWRDEAKNVWSGAREPYSKEWQQNEPEDPPSTSWLNRSVHHVGFRVVMEE